MSNRRAKTGSFPTHRLDGHDRREVIELLERDALGVAVKILVNGVLNNSQRVVRIHIEVGVHALVDGLRDIVSGNLKQHVLLRDLLDRSGSRDCPGQNRAEDTPVRENLSRAQHPY